MYPADLDFCLKTGTYTLFQTDPLPFLRLVFSHRFILSMAIVQFKARARQEPDVWQCRCGCYTFWLYSSGSAYCSECREEAVTMGGYWQIPEKTTQNQGAFTVIALQRTF